MKIRRHAMSGINHEEQKVNLEINVEKIIAGTREIYLCEVNELSLFSKKFHPLKRIAKS